MQAEYLATISLPDEGCRPLDRRKKNCYTTRFALCATGMQYRPYLGSARVASPKYLQLKHTN